MFIQRKKIGVINATGPKIEPSGLRLSRRLQVMDGVERKGCWKPLPKGERRKRMFVPVAWEPKVVTKTLVDISSVFVKVQQYLRE